jgi:hypothetical protein
VCGVTGWFRRIAVVAGAFVVLVAGGCSGDGKGPVEPPPPSTARVTPSAPPTGTAEEQILAQYRRFWTETLPAAQAAPVERRSGILAETVMEPALSFLVEGIRKDHSADEKPYGHAVPIGETLKRRHDLALVTGCLDSSHSGKADAQSGKVLTKGPSRELVLVTLKLGADLIWRVYETGFPDTGRC